MFTTEREGERETIAKQDGKRGYCNIFRRERAAAREEINSYIRIYIQPNPIFLITITSST